jgi:uncharacterized protein (UPF0548 family)
MFLVRRPAARDVDRFVAASRALPLSYTPIGLAVTGAAGFQIDDHTSIVGYGVAAFERATTALRAWRHFELGWVEVFPKGASIAPASVVAVFVQHLGFYSLNGCRVVYPIGDDSDHEFGFAYGTLTNHAECGEEIFKITLDPHSGAVSYIIRAASRPRALLARLGYPVTRSLQARFRRDSARAVARAVAG